MMMKNMEIASRLARIARRIVMASPMADPSEISRIKGSHWLLHVTLPGMPGWKQGKDIADLWLKSGITEVDWDEMDSIHEVMKKLGWPRRAAARYSKFRSLDDIKALFINQDLLTLDILKANQDTLAKIFDGKRQYSTSVLQVRRINQLESILKKLNGLMQFSDFSSIEELNGFISIFPNLQTMDIEYARHADLCDKLIEFAGRPENAMLMSDWKIRGIYARIAASIDYSDTRGAKAIGMIMSDGYASERIRDFIAQNTSVPESIVSKLVDTGEYEARFSASMNTSIGEDLLFRLAHDKDTSVRGQVALNPSATPKILEYLSNDRSYWIRSYVARHDNTPDKVLQRMAGGDIDSMVRQHAQNALDKRRSGRQ